MSSNLRLFFATALTCFALDQASKQWVLNHIPLHGRIEVIADLFYLSHVRNPGAAFSLFANASAEFRQIFFIGIGGLAIVMILSFVRSLSPGDRLSAGALGAILGGAVGNLCDRIFRGEEFFLGGVVDWIHVRLDWIHLPFWTGKSFPDFNLADSSIVIGVGLLVLELFRAEGELEQAEMAEETTPREE